MAYETQTWNKYDTSLNESQNIGRNAVATPDKMNHMEQGISAAHADIEQMGIHYRPNMDKTAMVKVVSFPLAADLIDDGARIEFNNITISCMCSSGPFQIDIPAGKLDFAHGQNICVDTSTRATDIIFVQPDWPTEDTVWAIGSMTTNALIINGTATQRKIVTIYGAGNLARDYT